jgi:hypothetical protein
VRSIEGDADPLFFDRLVKRALCPFVVTGYSIEVPKNEAIGIRTQRGRPSLAMNELAMNLSSKRVDYRYLKVLIVGKALVAEVLCKFLAMHDRFGTGREFNALPVSQGNAVLHVEEKFLHSRQPWFVLVASQFLFLNSTRSDTATCRC